MNDKELKKELEKTIDILNSTVESFKIRIKKVVTSNLNKLVKIEETTNESIEKLSKKITKLNKSEKSIKQALVTQIKAFKGIEETFYILYHNIQRNQYLYANNPEEWWNNYIDLKKTYKEENKEFEDKCKDVDEHFFTKVFQETLDELCNREESIFD